MEQNRIETGAVQFGSDWPCVTIRGDGAMYYNMQLNILLQKVKQEEWAKDYAMIIHNVESLQKLLSGCSAQAIDSGDLPCQFMKPFKECIKPQEKEDE